MHTCFPVPNGGAAALTHTVQVLKIVFTSEAKECSIGGQTTSLLMQLDAHVDD